MFVVTVKDIVLFRQLSQVVRFAHQQSYMAKAGLALQASGARGRKNKGWKRNHSFFVCLFKNPKNKASGYLKTNKQKTPKLHISCTVWRPQARWGTKHVLYKCLKLSEGGDVCLEHIPTHCSSGSGFEKRPGTRTLAKGATCRHELLAIVKPRPDHPILGPCMPALLTLPLAHSQACFRDCRAVGEGP